jgi:hypothetical protein
MMPMADNFVLYACMDHSLETLRKSLFYFVYIYMQTCEQ